MTDKENCWKVVPLERSYDMRAQAILAFNTATANGADRDDALQAAWEAEFRTAPAAPVTGHQFADARNMVVSVALTDEQIVIAGMNHFSRCEVPEAMLSYIAAVRECLELAAPAAPAPVPAAQTLPWRCFHCDLTLTDEHEAAEHFGTSIIQEPACQIDMAKFREMEELVRRSNAEDTDLHREIARLQGEHSRALQREEEKGYARALRDVGVMREGSQASLDVLAERQRQISGEGWTPEHDDKFTNGALSLAAGTYALHGPLPTHGNVPLTWPWDHDGWKPTTSRRNLVKAGALIIAEIERLDRAANTAAIAADGAGNGLRAQVIARAVAAHNRAWPEQLTSGVMFYEGERITKAEFMAALRGAEG